MSKCVFCNKEDINEGLLDQTLNFYHRVNVRGAMAPGHSMIISKRHFSCFGEMPRDLDEEYDSFKKLIEQKISQYFSQPLIMEQGIHGQSVAHAHIHFLPSVSDWYNFKDISSFLELVPKEISVTKCIGIEDVRVLFKEEGQYVSIERQGELYLCHTKGYSGLFRPIREFPCKVSGINHLLFWQTMPEEEKEKNKRWIEETIGKLRRDS